MPSTRPLLPDGLPPGQSAWHNIEQLVRKHRISRNWIAKRLGDAGYGPFYLVDPDTHLPIKQAYYPPDACEMIDGAVQALRAMPELGSFITLRAAAEQLGTTENWVKRHIESLGLPAPRQRKDHRGRPVTAISRQTIAKLREIRPDYPPDGWYNRKQLAVMSGRPNDAVLRMLTKSELTPQQFLSPLDGRPHDYYPPEAVRLLGRRKQQSPPAGDWLTAHQMQVRLGRTAHWVSKRLAAPAYAQVAQERRNDDNVLRVHYPPWVLAELTKMSEYDRVPEATVGWYTANRIAQLIGKSRRWTNHQLGRPEHRQLARRRVVRKGHRLALHYPRGVYLALKAEAERTEALQ